MGRKEKLASQRRKLGLPPVGEPYQMKYVDYFERDYQEYYDKMTEAKRKGWQFREDADIIFDKKEFKRMMKTYEGAAKEIGRGIVEVVFGEQLATNNESIAQAVMLWHTWPDLVAEDPNMTEEKFRGDEKEYFRRLREKYDDDVSYDLAMSY